MLQGERGDGEGENACMHAYRYIYRHMLQMAWGGDDRNIYSGEMKEIGEKTCMHACIPTNIFVCIYICTDISVCIFKYIVCYKSVRRKIIGKGKN